MLKELREAETIYVSDLTRITRSTPQSVLHQHRVITKALNDAVKWQFNVRIEAYSVTPPKPEKSKMKTLNVEQVMGILHNDQPSHYYPVMQAGIYTGMRREILGLKWVDVDFENKILYVRRTLQSVVSQGLVIRNSTKTNKGRPVAMADGLVKLLHKLRIKQRQDNNFWERTMSVMA